MDCNHEHTTIRVSTRARARAAALAARAGRSPRWVEEAIDAYRADLFWREAEQALDRLAADPQAWSEMMAERAAWEATLTDGLDRYEEE